jgi:hypothetical protein
LDSVRLACVRHAASVRPEPGSNSPSRSQHPRTKAQGCTIRRAEPVWLHRSNWHSPNTSLTMNPNLCINNCSGARRGPSPTELDQEPPGRAPALASLCVLSSVVKERAGVTETTSARETLAMSAARFLLPRLRRVNLRCPEADGNDTVFRFRCQLAPVTFS